VPGWLRATRKHAGKAPAKGMPLRGVEFMSELKLRPTNREAGGACSIVYFLGASERMRSISRRPLAPQPVASSGIAGRNFT
jgi:hypothetical protein